MVCVPVRPPGSVAVTVTVAVPPAWPTRVRLLRDSQRDTTSAFDVSAEYLSASPSGSLKYSATSKLTDRPASRFWAGIEPTGAGARLDVTVTFTLCVALRPSGSVAVTVTVTVPRAPATMVRLLRDIDTETTPASEDVAAYSSASPSGSLKYRATSSRLVRPGLMFWAGIEPACAGARLGTSTVTSTLCVALRPSGSVALTVTVAVPSATPVSVSVLPDIDTDTAWAFDVVAAYRSTSPSGSLKYEATSSVAVLPTSTLRAGIEPAGAGARLDFTVTSALCVPVRPPGSVAVTVTVAVPSATATMVRLLPDIDTETTPTFDEVAAYRSASPSESLKYEAMSSVTVRPTLRLSTGSEPTGAGALLGVCTVTPTVCVALRPSGSVAVTTAVAAPSSTPTRVRLLPDIDTETTLGYAVVTPYRSASPSGSLKYDAMSSVTGRPTSMFWVGTEPTSTGAPLDVCTVTPTVCVALRRSGSVAVTITVAVPSATPTSVRLLPDIDTETARGDDVAAA